MAQASTMPVWRGFNLLEKFTLGKNKPYQEEDFKMMAGWGFNFVRLPLDYRIWIKGGDWNVLDEKALKEVDQAVAWGKKYKIHVCLNFHRAPGYCCNPPKEPRDLWNDPEAQRVCAMHWAAFARRYKGIPSSRLSFNLFNEPSGVSDETYTQVAEKMIEAIHAEDKDRLIISDGTGGGTKPVASLPFEVIQSTRGYAPHYISHYKAPWAGEAEWTDPVWPKPILNAVLSGEGANLDAPLVLKGGFLKGGTLKVKIKSSSEAAKLKIMADEKVLLRRKYPLRADQAWQVLEPADRKQLTVRVPAGTRTVSLRLEGGYLVISDLRVQPGGGEEVILPLSGEQWDMQQEPAILTASGALDLKKTPYYDRQWMWDQFMAPWLAMEKKGLKVHVGEFACYNQTPHVTTLCWMEDWLYNWKKAGWGWAMWNFRGSMGIMDSGRADVVYEEYKGHKLDRKMLDLLRKY